MSSEAKNSPTDIFQSIKPLLESLSKFSIGIQHWHEKSQELAIELQKDDVFLIPYFSELSKIYALTHIIKTENKSMLEIYDGFFSQKENVQKILESWMNNPFYKERRQIFERCLYAHVEKDYVFTVPLFYIHIEKYCKNLLGIEGIVPYAEWKKQLQERYKSKMPEEGFAKFISDEYVVDILTNQIFEHYPKYITLTDPKYPNRHDVLHGTDLNYFNKDHASLRCILLLDILSEMEPKKAEIDDTKPVDSVPENS